MESYKIRIEKTLSGEVNPLGRRRVKIFIDTELPFVPIIGMKWEDIDLGIDIPVTGLTWEGENRRFLIRHTSSSLEEDEVNEKLKTALEKGWKEL
ncbi:hypothetical protein D3C76_320500 [compost metagenome]